MSGYALDSGALIAFERGDRQMLAIVQRARLRREMLAVPVGAVAQVWRDGRKQARLARFLSSSLVDVVSMDNDQARAAGQLCGVTGTSDVVDASVVVVARERKHPVVTSDPEDITRLNPDLSILSV